MEVNKNISKIPDSVENLKSHFPKKTAGRIMVTDIPIVLESFNIGDAEAIILKKVKEFETINYLYAVDKHGRLKGVISVKELFFQPKNIVVSDVMEKKVVSARTHTDQERVASLALKYSLKAVPVVDKKGVFLGVVTSDTILKVLHEEHGEDILYKAGVFEINSASGVIENSTRKIVKARIPWLVLGLFGGILAAVVMGRFEDLLKEQIVLALFVPVIVYMGDAVRSQTQTIFIRAVATDGNLAMGKYFSKELSVGISLSVILALLLGITVLFLYSSFMLAFIISFSMLVTVFMAVVIALIIPIIFLRFKKDTAVGSGPFSTILSDVLSILIYFSVAQVLINWIGL